MKGFFSIPIEVDKAEGTFPFIFDFVSVYQDLVYPWQLAKKLRTKLVLCYVGLKVLILTFLEASNPALQVRSLSCLT